jgi:hypothetical protein
MERSSSHSGCEIGYDTIEYTEFFIKSVACPKLDTEAHVLDMGMVRIMRQVSWDVLPEDNHIFQDCERPFKRTIKLIGDTDRALEVIGAYRMHDED